MFQQIKKTDKIEFVFKCSIQDIELIQLFAAAAAGVFETSLMHFSGTDIFITVVDQIFRYIARARADIDPPSFRINMFFKTAQ